MARELNILNKALLEAKTLKAALKDTDKKFVAKFGEKNVGGKTHKKIKDNVARYTIADKLKNNEEDFMYTIGPQIVNNLHSIFHSKEQMKFKFSHNKVSRSAVIECYVDFFNVRNVLYRFPKTLEKHTALQQKFLKQSAKSMSVEDVMKLIVYKEQIESYDDNDANQRYRGRPRLDYKVSDKIKIHVGMTVWVELKFDKSAATINFMIAGGYGDTPFAKGEKVIQYAKMGTDKESFIRKQIIAAMVKLFEKVK
jgi:hypothetical protein